MNPRKNNKESKLKIYLASSWRNKYQPDAVLSLREDGHAVYDFRNPKTGNNGFQWSSIDPSWQSLDCTQFCKALKHPIAVDGFMLDWGAMKWAEVGLLLLPCGRSAHLEAGYFVGADKPLIIFISDGEPELMYGMADFICVSMIQVKKCLKFIQRTKESNEPQEK